MGHEAGAARCGVEGGAEADGGVEAAEKSPRLHELEERNEAEKFDVVNEQAKRDAAAKKA